MSEEAGTYEVNFVEGELCKNCIHRTVCRFKGRMAGAEKVANEWEEERIVIEPEDPTIIKAECKLKQVQGEIDHGKF